MAILLGSPCGCVSLEQDYLRIIDSNNIYFTGPIDIAALRFDDTLYTINTRFLNREAILDYLKSTFVGEFGFTGHFIDNAPFMYYSNPLSENFQSAEIMAIERTDIVRFALGNPGFDLNKDYISLPDATNVIEHSSLIGVDILQVQVSSTMTEPRDDEGWSQDPDPLSGRVSYPITNYPQNCYVHITYKQSLE